MKNNTTPRKFGPQHVPFMFVLAMLTAGPVAKATGANMGAAVAVALIALCVVFALVMGKGGRA